MGLGIPEMMLIGGGLGLLSGGVKGGIKGAALGGIGGGIGNALKGSMIPGAVANGVGTNALAGGDVVKGLTMNAGALGGSSALSAVPGSTAFWQGANTAGIGGGLNATNAIGGIPGATAFEASMGLPNTAFLESGGSLGTALGGRASQMGMNTIGSGSTLYNPEYFSNVLGNPIYTGNEGLLSRIGTGAGSIFDTAKANLPDYVTPQNVLGAANIISNIQPQQPQFAPAGGVKQGNTQGLNVNYGMAQRIKHRGYA